MDLFARLQEPSGLAAIHSLIGSAEESLHLEFKTLRQTSGSSVSREDRTLIAKAITGLANAEGGLLILGVRTEAIEGIDVAKEAAPISEIAAFRNRLVSLIPEFLSPQHDAIQLVVLVESDGSGYGAIYVPPSSRRPHMCVTDHRFYRRGSQGNRMMEQGEIRDLMFAPRSAELEVAYRLRGTGNAGMRYNYLLDIGLRNTGLAPASLPYLSIDDNKMQICRENEAQVIRREAQSDFVGFFGSRDAVIHVEQELYFCQLGLGLDISRSMGQFEAAYYVQQAIDSDQLSMLKIGRAAAWSDPVEDSRITLECHFGAANASRKTTALSLSKRSLLRDMLKITLAFASVTMEDN